MNVGVIGAGASGMMAALISAENGAKVTLIERNDRIGKKILATGNGKCNFSHENLQVSDYCSQNTRFINDYFSQFGEKETLSFFQNKGMLVKNRNGYLYPRSEQSSTVLDVFRNTLKTQKNITIFTETYPVTITLDSDGKFDVKLNDNRSLHFDRIILASGSYAGIRRQDSYNSYAYAQALGHSLVPVVPALVQLRCRGKEFKSIAGVRCEVYIRLYVDNKLTAEEHGELQLTDYGISGIPVFQLSRHASYGIYEKKEVTAVIDFLPEYDEEGWEQLLHKKWTSSDKRLTAEEFFNGFLNKKLNLFFLKTAGIKAETRLGDLSYDKLKQAALGMKHWKVTVEAPNPFENAQVCAGGVPLSEVDEHLQSRLVPGLFFAGELLDVDGRCGGYNLQWAWTSGAIAGRYAAIP